MTTEMENDYRRKDNNIRELRKARGLNQTQLGELAGVSLRQISYWESGRGLSLRDACTLADIFGCTLDELADRDIEGADPVKQQICSTYELMNDEGKSYLALQADLMAKSGMFARKPQA